MKVAQKTAGIAGIASINGETKLSRSAQRVPACAIDWATRTRNSNRKVQIEQSSDNPLWTGFTRRCLRLKRWRLDSGCVAFRSQLLVRYPN